MTRVPRLTTFKVPFWVGLSYVAVLGVVATFPARHAATKVDAQPSASPAAAADQYTVCGVDRTADPKTGKCVPVAATPLPCVQGSSFDAKAGFCMPVAASPPPAPVVQAPTQVQQTDPFANLPGGIQKPAQPFDPFSNNSQP